MFLQSIPIKIKSNLKEMKISFQFMRFWNLSFQVITVADRFVKEVFKKKNSIKIDILAKTNKIQKSLLEVCMFVYF